MQENGREQAGSGGRRGRGPRREFERLRIGTRRTANLFRSTIALLLQVGEDRKPEIYAEVYRAGDFANLNYWLETIFSIGIATLGLIINSPAVVIGAMLISPLMGPIIASGLAVALGDFYLGIRAITGVALSTLASVSLAALITWVLPFRTPTPEILARVQPTLLDLGVAILSGLAGTIVVCRGGRSGGITALPGVAVAVALMPPLAVVGFGIGTGWNVAIIRGGALLYLTNLVAIIFCAFLVFFVVHLDSGGSRRRITEWLEGRIRGDRFYEAIERTPLRQLLGRVGTLPRRILTLLGFLAMVTFPLGNTLARLREEANLRRVVLEELKNVIPLETVFREDIEISDALVRVRVVAMLPRGLSSAHRSALEERIETRTGRPAELVVSEVATREALAALAPRPGAAVPPRPETLGEIRTRLWERVRPAIAEAWPADLAPLADCRVEAGPGDGDLRIRIAYLADEEPGILGETSLRRHLQAALGEDSLRIEFERIDPEARIPFGRRSDTLGPEERAMLERVAETLHRYPLLNSVLVGPDSSASAPGGSVDRSRRRIAAVRDRLTLECGISPERVSTARDPAAGDDALVLRLVPPPRF
jgi:uncharacterized hydrophobic protein (TIGR00271 family)